MSEYHQDRPKPVDYDELFPGRFLKAGLLKGKTQVFTIASVDREALPQENNTERDRGILSFKETKLQLVLNSTNGQCLRAMFGRKVQDWVGKRVGLVPEKDRFGRDEVDAIRIYGSPDITQDMTVEIVMPRKKPRTRVLHAPKKTREPGQEG